MDIRVWALKYRTDWQIITGQKPEVRLGFTVGF
jgi:hypothetical protein